MRNGLTHWWMQRITAVILLPALLAMAWWVARAPDYSAATMTAVLSRDSVACAVALAMACACLHAALGIQVVVEDYIAHRPGREILIYLTYAAFTLATACVALALLSLRA